MFRYHNITYLITDITLKSSLGLIFFNYGYGKLIKLLNQEADGLIGMVASIPFFGILLVISNFSCSYKNKDSNPKNYEEAA